MILSPVADLSAFESLGQTQCGVGENCVFNRHLPHISGTDWDSLHSSIGDLKRLFRNFKEAEVNEKPMIIRRFNQLKSHFLDIRPRFKEFEDCIARTKATLAEWEKTIEDCKQNALAARDRDRKLGDISAWYEQ